MIKESVRKNVAKAMTEIRVDIDIEYCKKHNIKFKNHTEEKDISEVDLFNSKSNKVAFDFLTKNL